MNKTRSKICESSIRKLQNFVFNGGSKQKQNQDMFYEKRRSYYAAFFERQSLANCGTPTNTFDQGGTQITKTML